MKFFLNLFYENPLMDKNETYFKLKNYFLSFKINIYSKQ